MVRPPRLSHLRALEYAQQCVAFDARPTTIRAVTGLSAKEVHRHFPPDRLRSGRCPSSPEWYHTANLIQKVEASIFLSHYRRIRDLGFAPLDALLNAYRRYLSTVGPRPFISFDRAFNLVCHLDETWGVGERSFDLKTCAQCRSRSLVPVGATLQEEECVFCRFVARYASDPRLQANFPPRPLPDLSAVKTTLGLLSYLIGR